MEVNNRSINNNNNNEDVSSVNTDRASNHGVVRIHNNHNHPSTNDDDANIAATSTLLLSSSPPNNNLDVPTTVVAINNDNNVPEDDALILDAMLPLNDVVVEEKKEVKLTAEALAIVANNNVNDHHSQRGTMYNTTIGEVSSNLSRSSSESGLKISTHNKGIPSQVKVIPSPIEEEGNETPHHFQPWEEAGSVASSLGDPLLTVPAVKQDLLLVEENNNQPTTSEVIDNNSLGMGGKALSELAMEVHNNNNLTNETPPKANLSRDAVVGAAPLPSNYNIASTPIPSPTKQLVPSHPSISVDSTIATTLPPAPSRSPMPASAMRSSSNNNNHSSSSSASPSIHRNNSKKATFQQPMVLTRTSSNASSSTTATNAGRIKVRFIMQVSRYFVYHFSHD